MPVVNQELPQFHPQTALRDWTNGQAFRLQPAAPQPPDPTGLAFSAFFAVNLHPFSR